MCPVCVDSVSHLEKTKTIIDDIFGNEDVIDSFRFYSQLIITFLIQTGFY